jgi:hypothetical protein
MEEMIRAFDPKIRKDIHERIKKTAAAIAVKIGDVHYFITCRGKSCLDKLTT